jgi:hypothetical protein
MRGLFWVKDDRPDRAARAVKKKTMNTHPKNNNEQGSGLLSHPEQVSGQGTAKHKAVYIPETANFHEHPISFR